MLSGKKRPPVKLSLFTNFSESFSSDYGSKSPTLSKSPRNFEGGVVGLGIVAAMNDTHEAFRSAKSSRAAKMAVSPKSEPIPIVSAKNIVKFRQPIVEKDKEIELSESYTCVISHLGNGKSVRKKEYFDEPEEVNWGNSGVFFTSPPPPPKNTQGGGALVFQGGDFLSSCYLCRKKLHGLDIFMYRGDRAFCSAECRSKQISSDEFKEKCGSGALKKAFDYSVTPCSAPRFLSSGVAAA